MKDRLADRSAAQHQDVQSGMPGVLRPGRRDDDPITGSGAVADRLTCFAEYLWGAVDASSVELPVPEPVAP